MKPYDISYALDHIVILIDTREQDNEKFRKRVSSFPCPTERAKLDFGDYSIKCKLPDDSEFSLQNVVSVERKMSLDEISSNFTRGRDRFEREFTRCKDADGKTIIVIENASIDMILNHRYSTQYNEAAFLASICTWQARFNAPVFFSRADSSPVLIYNLLYYELKERLKNYESTDERLD